MLKYLFKNLQKNVFEHKKIDIKTYEDSIICNGEEMCDDDRHIFMFKDIFEQSPDFIYYLIWNPKSKYMKIFDVYNYLLDMAYKYYDPESYYSKYNDLDFYELFIREKCLRFVHSEDETMEMETEYIPDNIRLILNDIDWFEYKLIVTGDPLHNDLAFDIPDWKLYKDQFDYIFDEDFDSIDDIIDFIWSDYSDAEIYEFKLYYYIYIEKKLEYLNELKKCQIDVAREHKKIMDIYQNDTRDKYYQIQDKYKKLLQDINIDRIVDIIKSSDSKLDLDVIISNISNAIQSKYWSRQ